MRLEPVSVLATLRELWSMPRDMARFHEYLARLREGPDGDLLLPLVPANPMARGHMTEYLDKLAVLDADRVVAEACRDAERRLAHVDLDTRVSLTPVDDVGGAWSERTLVDFDGRFPDRLAKRRNLAKYRFVGALVYASEAPTVALARERVLAAVYRAAHLQAHGPPETVGDMMRQEGRALRFAGLRDARGVDLDARDHPTRFAAMYGDAAARRVGHKPLGVPENGGFAVALDDALREPGPPERFV